MPIAVADNRWVQVRYRVLDGQGEPIEPGERELTYLHGGYGAVLPKIEQALEGREAGYAASLWLEPEDAFGDYDPQLVELAPRDRFPGELEAGMGFEGIPGEAADGRIWIVTDFTDDTVVLDANHPLAGMALRFDVKVLDVREATPEEIEREALAAVGERGMEPDA